MLHSFIRWVLAVSQMMIINRVFLVSKESFCIIKITIKGNISIKSVP